MKKEKVLSVALGALLSIPSLMATDVFFYNGTSTNPLSSARGVEKIVFGQDSIAVTMADGSSSMVKLSDVDYFRFYQKSVGGVADIKGGTGVKVSLSGNTLHVAANSEIQNVTVYSINGRTEIAAKPNSLETSLSVESLNSGIYIVKVVSGSTVTVNKIAKY